MHRDGSGLRTRKHPTQRKKADLDERGRFRHTIRLDPKVEQKLRTVAEILGIDINASLESTAPIWTQPPARSARCQPALIDFILEIAGD